MTLNEILVRAGVLEERYADPAWQAWCEKHFVPQIDLAGLEDAQQRYQGLRMAHVWGATHDDEAERLERDFGVDLLAAKPSLAEQRRQPQ